MTIKCDPNVTQTLTSWQCTSCRLVCLIFVLFLLVWLGSIDRTFTECLGEVLFLCHWVWLDLSLRTERTEWKKNAKTWHSIVSSYCHLSRLPASRTHCIGGERITQSSGLDKHEMYTHMLVMYTYGQTHTPSPLWSVYWKACTSLSVSSTLLPTWVSERWATKTRYQKVIETSCKWTYR